MKRRMAKILAVCVAGAMVMGMAACGTEANNTEDDANTGADTSAPVESDASADEGNDAAAADSDISIGIVVKTATNAHFQDISYGAMLAGQDLGVNVMVDNTATESDVDGQITKCEDMITKGVDALILTPNDSDGVSGAVEAAHDAGIPFVTVDTEITNVWGDDVAEYMPNYIGVDHQVMAYELAKNVFDKMGGEGNIVILRGVDAASSSQERTAGFEQAVEEYEGITVLESQSASYDQDTAYTTLSDIIQAHSDIDAVLCCNDLMAVGAVNALEDNNITVGEDGVLVSGIDGNVIALESITEGKMYASAYDWSILQGYVAVVQAYQLITGEEVPELTFTPDVIVTSENIDEYLPHGEELATWNMGTAVETVSDYMWSFLESGLEEMGLSR